MALHMAAKHQQIGIMEMLCAAGVVDTGRPVVEMGKVLCDAVDMGRSRSVKYLLERDWPPHGGGSYVDCINDYHCTPLVIGAAAAHPRVVRLLIDAGADVSAGRPMSCINGVINYEKPLAMVERELDWKVHRQRRASEDELHRMEAIRRMLLRVDAIRAGSWLWCSRVRGVSAAAAEEGNGGGSGGAGSAAASLVAPIVRTRTAAGRRALVATMFRHSNKP